MMTTTATATVSVQICVRMCDLQTDENNAKNLFRLFPLGTPNCSAESELHRFNRIPIDVVISVMNAPNVIFPLFSTLHTLLCTSYIYAFVAVVFFLYSLCALHFQSHILRHVASHFRFHSFTEWTRSYETVFKYTPHTNADTIHTHLFKNIKFTIFFLCFFQCTHFYFFPRSPIIVNRETD